MSSAAAEEKTDSSASGGSSGAGGGKLVLIISLVNFVATVGIIAILMLSFQKQKQAPAVEDIQAGGHGAESGGHGESGGGGGAHGEAAKDAHGGGGLLGKRKAEFGKMVTLEQFTVNLSTPGATAPKFVRVNVSLEVPTDDAESEIAAKMPQVRNVIIDLFNSKRASDLAAPEGRDYLKEEIRNALNGFLVHGKVKGVFFTNFSLSG